MTLPIDKYTHAIIAGLVYVYLFSLGFPFYSLLFLLLLCTGGVLCAFVQGNARTFNWKHFAPVFLFLASLVFTTIGSQNVDRSVILSLTFLPGLLLFFILVFDFKSQDIKNLYLVLSVLGLIISANACWVAMQNPDGDSTQWILTMQNPNFVVPNDLIFLVIIIPLSLTLLFYPTYKIVKILAGLSIIMSLSAVTVYQSRGAILLALIGITILTIYHKKRYPFFAILGVLGFIILMDMITGFALISKFKGVWNSRLLYWMIAWAIFLDAPLLGQGPKTFGLLFDEYKLKIRIPDWITIDNRHAPWAHNLYLEHMAEQGILGIFSLIILIGFSYKFAVVGFNSAHDDIRLLMSGIIVSFSLFIIASIFEISFIRRWVVVTFFLFIGIILSLRYQNHKGARRLT